MKIRYRASWQVCGPSVIVSLLLLFSVSADAQSLKLAQKPNNQNCFAGDLPDDYGNMLVVIHDDYETVMLPFVEWKNMKGIPTEMVKISDIPNGNTYIGVKKYIKDYYDYIGLTFVLLVGTEVQVPTLLDWFPTGFPGSFFYGASDPSFAYLDKDHIPDIYVGRFPAETVDDAATMVARSLSYEMESQTTAGCYSRALCLGGENQWMHDAMNYVDKALTQYGYDIHKMYAPFLNSWTIPDRINERIEEGRGLVFYAGHGLEYRWSFSLGDPDDDYYIDDVHALNNDKHPVVVSAACLSSAFWHKDECFGEAWLRATNAVGDATGGIGFFGASCPVPTPVVWNVTKQFALAISRLGTPFCPKKTSLGGLSFEASYTAECCNNTPFFFQVFNLFGDPSLQVYTQTPANMYADYPDSLPAEATGFSMTVYNTSDSSPRYGALCAVSQNGELLASGFTDLNGEVTFTFPALTEGNLLDLVATAGNRSSIIHEIPVQQNPPGENGNLLIITHPDYYNAVLPLVDWKNMKGIPTEIVDVTAVGSVPKDIKGFIRNYDETVGLSFVLLVGDIEDIPSFYVSGPQMMDDNASDPSYTYLDGDGDHYPNFYIGRFPAGSLEEAETMVYRSIDYEKEPEDIGSWYHMGSCFGGDATPLDLERIRNELLASTYTHVDYLIYPFTVSDVHPAIENINEGRSLLFYQGHGLPQVWAFFSENIEDIANIDIESLADLQNVGRLPLVVHNGCLTGDFTAPECIGEEFLRAFDGVPDQPMGAIAYFGSSDEQLFIPFNPGNDAIYEMSRIVAGTSDNRKTTLGGICFGGCIHMNNVYSNGYLHTDVWHLLGDPSVQLRTDTPYMTHLIHDPVIVSGDITFEVEVTDSIGDPVEGALCAISRNGSPLRELLGRAYTKESGVALISFDEPLVQTGNVDLVVTGYNSVTTMKIIPVVNP